MSPNFEHPSPPMNDAKEAEIRAEVEKLHLVPQPVLSRARISPAAHLDGVFLPADGGFRVGDVRHEQQQLRQPFIGLS